ncbi:MAG: N-acetylmuramoyl-L-alanine amidase [Clostridiales bacterium]|nr:N-acetylmuramoyl-L-alanine amidase [Clostridiales bacterium]
MLVQKDQVNVRQGAGTDWVILGQVQKGDTLAKTGATGDWAQVDFGGRPGYIRNDMLLCFDEIVVSGTNVRIRVSPSLQGAVSGSVQKGERLDALSYQEGWYQVLYGDGKGWISADFAKPYTGALFQGQPSFPTGSNQFAAVVEKGYSFESVVVSDHVQEGVLSGKIITLDPGHGALADNGSLDPGAQGPKLGIWEKDVNLDITLKLKDMLEKMGATVWLTHLGATRLSLNGRAALANKNASHIFVSIHANASESVALQGHSVYFFAPADDARLGSQRQQRQALASSVQNSLVQTVGRTDLGVKEGNFVVLREADCPSILVETAYLTHGEEELLLAQGAFRQRLADAIAVGIMRYFGAAV